MAKRRAEEGAREPRPTLARGAVGAGSPKGQRLAEALKEALAEVGPPVAAAESISSRRRRASAACRACPARFADDVAEDGPPHEREVAEEVEGLVPDELVRETEVAVLDALLADDDAVLEARARGRGRAP